MKMHAGTVFVCFAIHITHGGLAAGYEARAMLQSSLQTKQQREQLKHQHLEKNKTGWDGNKRTKSVCLLQSSSLILPKDVDVKFSNSSSWLHVQGGGVQGERVAQGAAVSSTGGMGFNVHLVWQQSLEGLKYAAEHNKMRFEIPSIIFIASLLLLSLRALLYAHNSSDDESARSSCSFQAISEESVERHIVFVVRIPVLSLAVATLTLLAGSQFAVLVAVFAGARTAQDALGLWHVTSIDGLSLKMMTLAQIQWNGAQVLHCLAVVCSWASSLNGSYLAWTTLGTCVLMPLSLYVATVGGYLFACLTVVTSVILAWGRQDVQVQCFTGLCGTKDAAKGHEPTAYLCKVESLFSVCCLLSSMYNAVGGANFFPYWMTIYSWLQESLFSPLGLTSKKEMFAYMYGWGLDSALPTFIHVSASSSHIPLVHYFVFALIWGFLPFLYFSLFCLLMALSMNTMSGTSGKIAQCLSAFGIIHFLFVTDLVDYAFGRGISNPWADIAHMTERVCWRIVLLLPIYQKILKGALFRGYLGCIHYVVVAYAITFFVYQILLCDIFCLGVYSQQCQFLYPSAFTYVPAVGVMAVVYACMSAIGPCHYLVLTS